MLDSRGTLSQGKLAMTPLAPARFKITLQPFIPSIATSPADELPAIHPSISALSGPAVDPSLNIGAPYSSNVVISPGSKPSSWALSRRRMILPERVLGSTGVNSNSEGTAMGPNSRRTWFLSAATISSDGS